MNPPTRNVPAWITAALPSLTCMVLGYWMGQSPLGWLAVALTNPLVLFG